MKRSPGTAWKLCGDDVVTPNAVRGSWWFAGGCASFGGTARSCTRVGGRPD
jgi:hypothetical protein